MPRKPKAPPCDGFGPAERKKVDSALRQVWYRCKARQTAIKRCTDADGFLFCEKCMRRVPKLQIDHIIPVGDLLSGGALARLFIPSPGLQGLCKACHNEKTKHDNAKRKVSVSDL